MKGLALILSGLLTTLLIPTETSKKPGEPPSPPATNGTVSPAGDPTIASGVSNSAGTSKDAATDGGPTKAEQLTALTRSIENDQKNLAEIQANLEDPDGEYAMARADFEAIETRLKQVKAKQAELETQEDPAASPEDIETARRDVDALQNQWQLARDRLNLAIEERETLQAQVQTLQQAIQGNQEKLDQLQGNQKPEPPAATPAVASGGDSVEPSESKVDPAQVTQPDSGSNDATGSETAPPVSPMLPGVGAVTSPKPTTPDAAAAPPATQPVEESKELVEAKADIQAKTKAADDAREEATGVEDRLSALDNKIELLRKRIETSRKKRTNAEQTRDELVRTFQDQSIAGVDQATLQPMMEQIQEAQERVDRSSEELAGLNATLEELYAERKLVYSERLGAQKKLLTAMENVKVSEKQIEALQNPFTPRNILRWLLDHGPRLILIVVGMLCLKFLTGVAGKRVVHWMARSTGRGTRPEREERAKTLISVFQNATTVGLFCGGMLMIFEEVGVPIAPLLGGAAVVGLAVAFGAQNLIRDYFYGFVILIENQYKLNDVVRIGGVSGVVEHITLRMTVLRDLEGTAHFLPNGNITAVANLTHGWSRALFEIGVAYKENVDHVIGVLMELAEQMRKEPQFGWMIQESPTMLGVDAFGDSAVLIKFFIKTRPSQQWTVKRELLRRIKNRFDELNIEIPVPQRTIYHRYDDPEAAPAALVETLNRLRASA